MSRIAAAAAIRAKGKVQNPLGLAYAPGWELGQGFVNLYLGQDGAFIQVGAALPSINNAKGIKALETMKALAGYMGPDYLTWSSDALVPLLESNTIALTNFWGSEASEVLPGT